MLAACYDSLNSLAMLSTAAVKSNVATLDMDLAHMHNPSSFQCPFPVCPSEDWLDLPKLTMPEAMLL